MIYANMKVGTKFSVGFGLVLLMLLGIVFISLIKLWSIKAIHEKMITEDWVRAQATAVVNATTRENARRTMQLLIISDQTQISQIEENIKANKLLIDVALTTLNKLTDQAEAKDVLAKINAARNHYVVSFKKVIKLVNEGKKDEAISLTNAETLPALDALQEPIVAMSVLQSKFVVARNAEITEDIRVTSMIVTALGVSAVLLGIMAAYIIARSISRPLGEALHIAQVVAAGDLTSRIDATSSDETGQLLLALKIMNDSLSQLVGEVRGGTENIGIAVNQIAAGNLDLSARTEAQAGALEETASSMEELTSVVKQNADSSREAKRLAQTASETAVRGGAVVAQVVDTMGQINESSKKIADIIGVIDSIAFQTNILALNAAVEAARAGEQGRGFAVVASEVRNLAQRSAAAAKEIKTLISASVDKVELGAKLVDQAGSTMNSVVESVERVVQIITEITHASGEQTAGIEQINQAIIEMDNVTQQNAALVEQAAAAAQSLHVQSQALSRSVSVFRLAGENLAILEPETAARLRLT